MCYSTTVAKIELCDCYAVSIILQTKFQSCCCWKNMQYFMYCNSLPNALLYHLHCDSYFPNKGKCLYSHMICSFSRMLNIFGQTQTSILHWMKKFEDERTVLLKDTLHVECVKQLSYRPPNCMFAL